MKGRHAYNKHIAYFIFAGTDNHFRIAVDALSKGMARVLVAYRYNVCRLFAQ
jgi:hypothetical protein